MSNGARCSEPGCPGRIAPDGYCDTCGAKGAPAKPAAAKVAAAKKAPVVARSPVSAAPAPAPAAKPGGATTGTLVTGSARSAGARRGGTTRTTTSRRTSTIGAGLVEVPPQPTIDASTVILADPLVAENKRFCSKCGAPVGRPRPDVRRGRTSGTCTQCGHPFDFEPKLRPGEVLNGQYEVAGCLAHGGLGWIYLARDKAVNGRWTVLKGLLDAGDEAAMRVAVAERQFLAELSHPGIVEIFNFVTHRGSGYIVMEYVGGPSLKQILKRRQEANGDKPDPLPPEQALAYLLAILPAFGYLHGRGIIYCDFKPDNLIQVVGDVKMIDMGAVRRIDDPNPDVYGTVGFQAPEIATDGPSVASDIYTIGRTLAVLTLDFRGYQKEFAHSLPDPADHSVLREFDSFHRLLLKATAPHPDDRFQTVSELGDQMLGVMREIVAVRTGKPQAAPSQVFGPAPDDGTLPALAIDPADPAAAFLANLAGDDPRAVLREIDTVVATGQVPETIEVQLRRVRALLDIGPDATRARTLLDAIEQENPWEWRAVWLRGLVALDAGDLDAAAAAFERCRSEVPGEVAPKLAAAIVAERAGAGQLDVASALYDSVVRLDPSYVAAARGLARSRAATGDIAGALAAYDRIPTAHRAHADAQIEAVRMLMAAGRFGDAEERLRTASIDEGGRARLEAELFETALANVGSSSAQRPTALGGQPFTERGLRLGLERALLRQARFASTLAERYALVDKATALRPLTVL